MDVALIGCGFIGSLIAEHFASGKISADLKILLDRHNDKMRAVQGMFENPPEIAKNINEIASSSVDLVIEAASIEAVHIFSQTILASGKDMMIMSVGALSDHSVYREILRLCREKDTKVYLPSGAIGGLDAVASGAVGGLSKVELTTIKNPHSLMDAPYVIKNKIDLSGIKNRSVLFTGNADEAVRGFPSNVNVAIALSLAGIGVEKTFVKIIADPRIKRNVHRVRARGAFGKLEFTAENIPSTDNPKTSLLAALSAISMLKKITEPIKIG